MSAEQIDALFALALGFAFAGLIATGYQVFTHRPASFEQLQQRPRRVAFAAVPMLVFAAPFIIMRNTIRAARDDGRTFMPVMMATIIAGCWSLMSGTVVLMALSATASAFAG